MTSISSQSNYGKARKCFPGIHVNSQEICTKVGKGGGAIMKIFGKPQQTDRCLHRKILFNFPKQFCFDPHHQSHNICEIHDSVIKLSILDQSKKLTTVMQQQFLQCKFNTQLHISSTPQRSTRRPEKGVSLPIRNNYIFSSKNALFWRPFAFEAL